MKNLFYGVNKRCKNDPETAAGKGSDSQLPSERGPFAKIRKGHWKRHHPQLIADKETCFSPNKLRVLGSATRMRKRIPQLTILKGTSPANTSM